MAELTQFKIRTNLAYKSIFFYITSTDTFLHYIIYWSMSEMCTKKLLKKYMKDNNLWQQKLNVIK